MLTANYMPEYGRASGGQIRFVTKSGSNRYTGNASLLLPRRVAAGQHLVAQQEPERDRELRRRAFDYKQYGYSFGGPIPGEHVQGQAVLLRRAGMGQLLPGADQHRRRCRPRRCARGDFSELLDPNTFFSTPQIIRDPLTGQPFPGNIIPPNRLSRQRHRAPEPYPPPTPGFQSGTQNAIFNSDNPQDQRKDNIRFDYRLNDEQPAHLPLFEVRLDGD